jgi:hypothetical protein
MSRFTDLFGQPQPVSEPTQAPAPVKEVVEDKVVPITKASKSKKITLD